MFQIYRFEFDTRVHFGLGYPGTSGDRFTADTLFSAVYIEALKVGKENVFYERVKGRYLKFSDSFPYAKDIFYLPKPLVKIMKETDGNSVLKKRYKKLTYIPSEKMDIFLRGEFDFDKDMGPEYGKFVAEQHAAVRTGGDAIPYHVGSFRFADDCGLYILADFSTVEDEALFEELLDGVSTVGIGGRRSEGLGKFSFFKEKIPMKMREMLCGESDRKMLISSALPSDEELSYAMEDSLYLLGKRSGFVYSEDFDDTMRRKKDMYVFEAGSCFNNIFNGDIYDVSEGGRHPVYRYAEGFFLSLPL